MPTHAKNEYAQRPIAPSVFGRAPGRPDWLKLHDHVDKLLVRHLNGVIAPRYYQIRPLVAGATNPKTGPTAARGKRPLELTTNVPNESTRPRRHPTADATVPLDEGARACVVAERTTVGAVRSQAFGYYRLQLGDGTLTNKQYRAHQLEVVGFDAAAQLPDGARPAPVALDGASAEVAWDLDGSSGGGGSSGACSMFSCCLRSLHESRGEGWFRAWYDDEPDDDEDLFIALLPRGAGYIGFREDGAELSARTELFLQPQDVLKAAAAALMATAGSVGSTDRTGSAAPATGSEAAGGGRAGEAVPMSGAARAAAADVSAATARGRGQGSSISSRQTCTAQEVVLVATAGPPASALERPPRLPAGAAATQPLEHISPANAAAMPFELDRLRSQIVRLSQSGSWRTAGLTPLTSFADPSLEQQLESYVTQLCPAVRGGGATAGTEAGAAAGAEAGSAAGSVVGETVGAIASDALDVLLREWRLCDYASSIRAAATMRGAHEDPKQKLLDLSAEQVEALVIEARLKPGHAMKFRDKLRQGGAD
mmetsp:Transcript_29291/g.75483  ORF Transcript_29291/g.75483 Transcript_29291/m.75483 type:complete len:539 (-) Transcript_29291:10-1626(-)